MRFGEHFECRQSCAVLRFSESSKSAFRFWDHILAFLLFPASIPVARMPKSLEYLLSGPDTMGVVLDDWNGKDWF